MYLLTWIQLAKCISLEAKQLSQMCLTDTNVFLLATNVFFPDTNVGMCYRIQPAK